MACLDTTVLLDLSGRKGRPVQERARSIIAGLVAAGESLVTTRFNSAELWVGVMLSNDPTAEQERVEGLLAPLRLLEFDAPSATLFAKIVGELRRRGTSIGDLDALIAAVTLAHDGTIVTRNPKHFSRVPGLIVQSY